MPRGDNVRDAVCDNPGLAAARTRENQKRPFRMGHCFPLLRVEPFEEIHEMGNSLSLACVTTRLCYTTARAVILAASDSGQAKACPTTATLVRCLRRQESPAAQPVR